MSEGNIVITFGFRSFCKVQLFLFLFIVHVSTIYVTRTPCSSEYPDLVYHDVGIWPCFETTTSFYKLDFRSNSWSNLSMPFNDSILHPISNLYSFNDTFYLVTSQHLWSYKLSNDSWSYLTYPTAVIPQFAGYIHNSFVLISDDKWYIFDIVDNSWKTENISCTLSNFATVSNNGYFFSTNHTRVILYIYNGENATITEHPLNDVYYNNCCSIMLFVEGNKIYFWQPIIEGLITQIYCFNTTSNSLSVVDLDQPTSSLYFYTVGNYTIEVEYGWNTSTYLNNLNTGTHEKLDSKFLTNGNVFALFSSPANEIELFDSRNGTFYPANIPSSSDVNCLQDEWIVSHSNYTTTITIVHSYNPYTRQLYGTATLNTSNINFVASTETSVILATAGNIYTLLFCQSNQDCDDGIYCNGVEYCENGYCSPALELPCNETGNPCIQCQEEAQSCFPSGNLCKNNTNFCDGKYTCDGAGSCLAAGNPCLNRSVCNQQCDTVLQVCTYNSYGTSCAENSCDICNNQGECYTPPYCSKKDNKNIAVIVGLSVLSCVLLSVVGVLLYFKFKPRKQYELVPTEEIEIQPTVYMIENIAIGNRLASGEFGDVYKGVMDRTVPVALKSLKISDYTLEFQREVSIISALNHPHVVRLFGIHQKISGEKYMVMEFLSGGSLNKLLMNEKSSFNLKILLNIAVQIASGMKYLEASRIIHRDLALRNVLVAIDNNNYIAKISDFGMSRAAEYYKTDNKTIPVRWSAPEFIQFGTTSSKSDVFSFGVCLWELMSYGATPYPGWSNRTVIDEVTKGYRLPKPDDCPDDLYQVMLSCWDEDPEKRPSFAQLHARMIQIESLRVNENGESIYNE